VVADHLAARLKNLVPQVRVHHPVLVALLHRPHPVRPPVLAEARQAVPLPPAHRRVRPLADFRRPRDQAVHLRPQAVAQRPRPEAPHHRRALAVVSRLNIC